MLFFNIFSMINTRVLEDDAIWMPLPNPQGAGYQIPKRQYESISIVYCSYTSSFHILNYSDLFP